MLNAVTCTSGPNSVVTVVLNDIDFRQKFRNVGDLAKFFVDFGHILLRMRRNAKLRASGYNSDNAIGISDTDFL